MGGGGVFSEGAKMSQRSDFGNFLVLLIGAAVVAVLIGDWAFMVVVVVGLILMNARTVVYILRGLGITFGTPDAVGQSHQSPEHDVESLLRAVAAQDGSAIERLVLQHNVSPFQNAPWTGGETNAHALAVSISYTQGATFFKEWSAKGSAARFPQPAQGKPLNS